MKRVRVGNQKSGGREMRLKGGEPEWKQGSDDQKQKPVEERPENVMMQTCSDVRTVG